MTISKVDPVFDRDKFLLRQKFLAISEKYDVWDEEGNSILYIERPAHFLRNLGAVLAGLVAGVAVGAVLFSFANTLSESLRNYVFGFALACMLLVIVVVSIWLSKKRNLTIYRDKSKQEPLLKVLQDKKFELITATFTIRDTNGDIAKFSKNYLYEIFCRYWHCYTPDGAIICIAKEDPLIMALMRRFVSSFLDLIPIKFVIIHGETQQLLGELNRQFTIRDRYVLDMSADQAGYLDRRIAIALGVMLDTGERR